jgi:carboxyl-terminal processing protease
MKQRIAWCAAACAVAFLVPPVSVGRAQTGGEALPPKEDLQLLSSAAARIKNDYVRTVDEAALAAGCAATAATSAGVFPPPQPGSAANLSSIPRLLMDLKSSAGAGTTYRKLVFGCIEGMVGQLDAHSKFYGPEDWRELQLGSDFRLPAGIGLELRGGDKEPVTVVGAIEGTPSARAGIRAGDRLLRIDGAPVDGKSLKEVVQALRGKTGSEITLALRRAGAPKPLEIAMKREIIRPPAASLAWLERNILHIRMTQFRFDARSNLLRELEKFTAGGARVPDALVLDLRDNTGGVLFDAMDIAGLFLPDGAPIGSTRGRGRDATQEIKANVRLRTTGSSYRPELPEPLQRAFREAPMAVLVSGRTASGAEMVAAALQENGRARLIGLPTLGLGSIQTVYPLDGSTALKLTHAIWYTPKNRPLDGDPLLPDVPIEAAPEAASADGPDKGLQEAVRYLAARRAQ